MLSKLIVLLLALVSSLADAGVEIANIKFGVLRQTGSGTYAMDVETTRIPLRLQETGFRFGITFENPTGAKIDWYEIMHLPSPLKATSGTLQSIEPKLLRTEKKSTRDTTIADVFWHDKGDPLGKHRLDLYVNGTLKHSVKFEVVADEKRETAMPLTPSPGSGSPQSAALTPPQSAPQAPYTQNSCSKELMTKVEEQGNGVVTVKRYRVQATSPLRIEITHGQTYLQDLNIPGVPRKQAGQFDWLSSNTYGSSEASAIVDKSGEEISRFSTCSSNNFCATSVTALKQERDWHQCLLKAANGTGGPAAQGDIDTVTPQVPGCPKYLRKSLVTWRQVGNPQLNTWEIRNISNKLLKVTFAEDGNNSDSPTLNPGDTAQVGLTGHRVPRYVVRDFDELANFNRTPEGRSGKTLQCQLAIRPR